ncbi:protein EMSY-LIKE 3-like isoform X2 [Andrographis paniculata]|uniref:protein EMSY-LIKE 3-like isoform X2 n=1 Tax=Andrographis paniculata TaxID=175694 RepID=UPI0021E97B36|nr:protein EMSY-LIKE 3-like isoform X2 [Andrographis paniculata]
MEIDMESEIHNLEQIAYGAVLRAFKAQSDALTWEKEGLITELRKELRVSDDEHRELLTEVNADDLIRRIREWREAGGIRNVATSVAPHVNSNQLPSPTVSASRKRQKVSFSTTPYGTNSQSLHPQSVAGSTQPVSSNVKWGPTSGLGGRRPNTYPFTGRLSSGAPMSDTPDNLHDSLVGRRVMIRWPADNNFYEAVINEYNPVDGLHLLEYDGNTPNATMEWVNIKEIPPEDIRWVGNDPVTSRLVEPSAPSSGRGRVSSINQTSIEVQPSRNGIVLEDSEEIEILHTDTLIKKVEKILDANQPDRSEIDKAKKMLKEHEQTLVQVIEKLAAACDSDDEHPSGPQRGRQQNTDVVLHGPGHELETAGRANSYELGES